MKHPSVYNNSRNQPVNVTSRSVLDQNIILSLRELYLIRGGGILLELYQIFFSQQGPLSILSLFSTF